MGNLNIYMYKAKIDTQGTKFLQLTVYGGPRWKSQRIEIHRLGYRFSVNVLFKVITNLKFYKPCLVKYGRK
jgi:hypothetical protein